MTWHLLAVKSKLVENFEEAGRTSFSGDNKEKVPTNIRSEYASDFCHDRKFALRVIVSSACIKQRQLKIEKMLTVLTYALSWALSGFGSTFTLEKA